jgi:uncharacterized membrane protein
MNAGSKLKILSSGVFLLAGCVCIYVGRLNANETSLFAGGLFIAMGLHGILEQPTAGSAPRGARKWAAGALMAVIIIGWLTLALMAGAYVMAS